MKPVNFKAFESVYEALKEGEYPSDIAVDGTNLLDAASAGPIAKSINEKVLNEFIAAAAGAALAAGAAGIIGFNADDLKNWVSSWMPGGVIKKANAVLAKYKADMTKKFEDIGKERLKDFEIQTKAAAKPNDKVLQKQAAEIRTRTTKVCDTIDKSTEDLKNAYAAQLNALARGSKKDRVKLYIDFALAKLKVELAKKEIEDAKEYTSEDQMKVLQEIVDKREKLAELYLKQSKLVTDLEKKDELKDGPKLPKVGKAVTHKGKDGKWAGDSQKTPDKWIVVKDVWNAKGETVDMRSHVVVIKAVKGGDSLPDDAGTADAPDKNATHWYIPVKSIPEFKDFDEEQESTIESNDALKKLRNEVKTVEDEIKKLEANEKIATQKHSSNAPGGDDDKEDVGAEGSINAKAAEAKGEESAPVTDKPQLGSAKKKTVPTTA